MARMFVLVASILACFTICLAANSRDESLLRAAEKGDAAYDRELSQGKKLMKAGRYAEALLHFKHSVQMPHSPPHAEPLPIFAAVAKDPLNPDGHIALGLYFMNILDPSFNVHNQITADCWNPQADYEFMVALDLSPNHHNAEVEKDLQRLAELKKLASANTEQTRRVAQPANFYVELIKSKWKPPKTQGSLITRADVDVEVGKAFIVVPSKSKQFDASVLEALKLCYEEYPFLDWDRSNNDFAFISIDGVTHVLTDEMSIYKSHGKAFFCGDASFPAAKKIADEGIAKYLITDSLLLYCKPDTLYAYKFLPRLPVPDRSVGGEFEWRFNLLGGKAPWRCTMAKGKPLQYELSLGDGWRFYLRPADVPSIDKLNDYVETQRVRDALFSCFVRKQVSDTMRHLPDEWFSRQPDLANMQESFVRDTRHNIVAYTCGLRDGRRLRADLNNDRSIEKISIDGKVDAVWMKAYAALPADQVPVRGVLH
jgi:hypothetical protein